MSNEAESVYTHAYVAALYRRTKELKLEAELDAAHADHGDLCEILRVLMEESLRVESELARSLSPALSPQPGHTRRRSGRGSAMDENTITLTKLDAGRRLLRAAIRMWFTGEDEVATFALAYAAHEVFHTLHMKAGGKHG